MSEQAYKTGNAASLAGLTAPRIVQTGGTQQTVQPFDWGGLLGAGVSGAATVAA